ncbi:MAG: hypothetical protein RRZ83_00405 [Alistipes sp.]
MDNFSDLLWILIIGGAAIASFVMEGKKKQQSKEGSDEVNTNEERARQILKELFEGTKSQTPQSDKQVCLQKKQQTHKPSASSVGPVPVSSMTGVNSVAAQTSVTTEHAEDIMSDFDLRKAVIWSEILKPKFDKES